MVYSTVVLCSSYCIHMLISQLYIDLVIYDRDREILRWKVEAEGECSIVSQFVVLPLQDLNICFHFSWAYIYDWNF